MVAMQWTVQHTKENSVSEVGFYFYHFFPVKRLSLPVPCRKDLPFCYWFNVNLHPKKEFEDSGLSAVLSFSCPLCSPGLLLLSLQPVMIYFLSAHFLEKTEVFL